MPSGPLNAIARVILKSSQMFEKRDKHNLINYARAMKSAVAGFEMASGRIRPAPTPDWGVRGARFPHRIVSILGRAVEKPN
jgi:hypothetical protein